MPEFKTGLTIYVDSRKVPKTKLRRDMNKRFKKYGIKVRRVQAHKKGCWTGHSGFIYPYQIWTTKRQKK